MTAAGLQRALTAAFVARAPLDVNPTGIVRAGDGEGGFVVSRGLARPTVRVTLCEPGSSGYGAPSATAEGVRRAVDFLLVAAWDADVRDGDEFDAGGVRYRVDGVLPANGWETRAYVVAVGKVPA